MAKSYRLVTTYLDADGKTVSFSYANAKSAEDMPENGVKTLMDTMIANGSIFKNVPVKAQRAYVIESDATKITNIDLS